MSSPDHDRESLENGSAQIRGRSMMGLSYRRLKRHTLAMVGASVIGLLIFTAVAAPWIAPYDPIKMEPRDAFQPPGREHPMGTDQYGRDLFSRVIFGARTSLFVGIVSVGIALLIGTVLGMAAGYYLGIADMIISRVVDVLYAFPPLLLALVLIAILGPGIKGAVIAIGVYYIPAFARVCRGSVLAEREKEYVDAARAIGASDVRIMGRHILPNVLAPLIVQVTFSMSVAILIEASLSYLGLGVQPPTPSWGMMLAKGRTVMRYSLWLSLWPGLAITSVVLAFNAFGDGLRDALDPRLIGK